MYAVQTMLKRDGSFVPINSTEPLVDRRYIEGAVRWTIDDQPLLTDNEWDLVDQLWAYIVDGAIEALRNGRSETYFPDQPLRLAFEVVRHDKVRVTVGERKAVVDQRDFVASLAEGARQFFSDMRALVPEGLETWTTYLQRVENNLVQK